MLHTLSTLYSPLPQTRALIMTHVSTVKSRLKEHDPRVEDSLEALIATSHPPMLAWGGWISIHLDLHRTPSLVAGGQAARAGSLQNSHLFPGGRRFSAGGGAGANPDPDSDPVPNPNPNPNPNPKHLFLSGG